jgi:rhodanese-related sulfurtransferase
VQVPFFVSAYARIADATFSASTMRRRRDEWIAAGAMEPRHALALAACDRMVGLVLDDVAVDCCITKAPGGGGVAGRSAVDRAKLGLKRSVAVDAAGIPLATIAAPANRHDSPLLEPALDALGFGDRPTRVHLDRGYDSGATRTGLASRGLTAAIATKGGPAPITAGRRWVVGRTNAWTNAHKKLVRCTERRAAVVAFWVAFSAVIVTFGRLARQAWTRYRWPTRPSRES